MNTQDVTERVKRISEMRDDDEMAHAAEDKLRADVLLAVATGTCDDPMSCAIEALKTADIPFHRWRA